MTNPLTNPLMNPLTNPLTSSPATLGLASSFLAHCLQDAARGLPFDVERVAVLLEDDDAYFAAAGALVEDWHRRGWRALRAELTGLPAYRAAVLEHGCSGFFRNAFEVIFYGELVLGPADT